MRKEVAARAAAFAELEATTVRKGNDRASLKLSDYYTQRHFYWNDGVGDSVYLSDLGPTQAINFRFSGQAEITPGWTTGQTIRSVLASRDIRGTIKS